MDLEIPGILALRATFLSEGLFDENSGGDPDTEDLYEVELTSAGEELLEPIQFSQLAPASHCDTLGLEEEGSRPCLPMEQFLLALAWELGNADPAVWALLCERARNWDPWTLEDILYRIPSTWAPVDLLPDED